MTGPGEKPVSLVYHALHHPARPAPPPPCSALYAFLVYAPASPFRTAPARWQPAPGGLVLAVVPAGPSLTSYLGEAGQRPVARVHLRLPKPVAAALATPERTWACRLRSALHALAPSWVSHSRRVARLAAAFARHTGAADPRTVYWAGLLHDLGKAGVPRAILDKPGPLTPAQRARMQQHPLWGAALALWLGAPEEVVSLILTHHERWDGRGYPAGLAGERIPEGAQVLALADAWDAMTHPRPYAPTRTPEEARQELLRGAGTQFHPELARAFARWIYPDPSGLP